MKKCNIIFILSMLFILTGCSGIQKMESENVESKSYHLDAFHSISVAEGIEVNLHKASEHRADATSNFLEYLRIRVNEEGVLMIDFDQPDNSYFKKNKTKVEVWASDVRNFKATSSGYLLVENQFRHPEQTIHVSSSGTVEYNPTCEKLSIQVSSSGDYEGTVDAETLELNATSSGDIKIKGRAKQAYIMASSSGDIEGKNLNVDIVNAEVSSSGDVRIGVNEVLNANVSSSGDLEYKPNGKIKMNINKSSGGDVKEIKNFLN